jgi:DHA3 family tetracycline resistance protein-like MFS transporter
MSASALSRRLVPRSLRHRDYTLLWGGQTVSVLGDGIYTIAIALEALRISDHASTLAYVETARVAPNALLLLLAGAIVDRLPRRLVILGADLLRGGAVAAIAVLAAAHALDVTWLVVLSAAVGVGDAFFYPAYRAVMPELLPPALLTQGNAFNSASQTIGQSFAGPAIGGVLVALAGTSAAFAVDAATFAVSGLCLILMRRVPAPAPSGRSVTADVRQGIRWTVRQRWLWFGILAVSVINFAGFSPMAVTVPLLVRDTLHQGPAAYGVTFAALGIGGLAAAVVAARWGTPRRRMSVIWIAWAAASLALAGVGVAPDVFVVAACGAVTYFGIVYGNLLWGALMQVAVPPDMLGRASSVDWLFSICLSPLGILFAGALAGPFGVRQTILLGAGLSVLSCLVVFVPGVRDPDQPGYRPRPLDADPGEKSTATPAGLGAGADDYRGAVGADLGADLAHGGLEPHRQHRVAAARPRFLGEALQRLLPAGGQHLGLALELAALQRLHRRAERTADIPGTYRQPEDLADDRTDTVTRQVVHRTDHDPARRVRTAAEFTHRTSFPRNGRFPCAR